MHIKGERGDDVCNMDKTKLFRNLKQNLFYQSFVLFFIKATVATDC
jgi:hypothetical protein